jgi:putative ATP-binding cassette transporter
LRLLTLLRELSGDWQRLLGLTIVGGLLAALTVTTVNGSSAAGVELGSWWRATLFVLILVGMYGARKVASRLFIADFERCAAELRHRFAASLRQAPLRAIEELGDRLERATGDLAFLSTTLEAWVSAVQHLAFALCMTVAIALISIKALGLWLFALAVVAVRLRARLRAMNEELRGLGGESARLGAQVEQLVDGFAQVKLDGRIAASLAAEIDETARVLYERQNAIENIGTRAFVGSFALMFLLGSGLAAFAPTTTVGLEPAEAYEMVVFFELAWAPLFGVVTAFPEILRAEAAAGRILDTIADLPPECEPDDEPPGAAFRTLELRDATFAYVEADGPAGFTVGPLNLTIRAGDLVLVTGGNGSGKTTMLKLLLGLYPASSGALVLDGKTVLPGRQQVLRDSFTTIMSHQHVFDRLHGLDAVEPARVNELLTRLGIAEVITYRNGAFSDLALSTGQKMRLAMVVALLEDRPVCVFDEWTANQDPETTHWYYDTLLPELLAAGKTVIAVSHDERFFDRADLLVQMDHGRLVRTRRKSEA